MREKDVSPEEKLLNLIRKKTMRAQQAPTGIRLQARQGSQDAAIRHPLPAQAGRGLAFGAPPLVSMERLRLINTGLFGALVVLVIYFFVQLFASPYRDDLERAPSAAAVPAAQAAGTEAMPYSYYSKALAGKNVFAPQAADIQQNIEPAVQREEVMASFSLVGIISGDEPQAIIEDTKQNKRFFIKEGQSAGDLTLKKINEGSVTVVYRGEEFGLSL